MLGFQYPGLHSSVKTYLWNSVGAPTLMYSMDCVPLTKSETSLLKSSQGTIIKAVMGLNKRNHHSDLLNALKVPSVVDLIKKSSYNFYHKLFITDTPLKKLQSRFLSHYMLSHKVVKNSLLDKLLKNDIDPIDCIFNFQKYVVEFEKNGIIDSLHFLICHDNYIKRWSPEFTLVNLLTQAF